MDIIIVDDHGTLRSTDWHVQVGNASVPIGSGASVRVFVNGALEDALAMHVGPDGTCHFPDAPAPEAGAPALDVLAAPRPTGAGALAAPRRLQPDAATLRKLKLEMGRNEVRYEVTGQTSMLETTVSLFVWDSEDPVVAVHVETAVFRRAALAKGAQALSFGRHSGQSFGWEAPWPYVCELLVYFDTAGYRIVLLTSSPITWCDRVRDRLNVIRGHAGRRDDEDDELRLPAAALLSTSQRSLRHAVNALVADAGSFQSQALSQVLCVCVRACVRARARACVRACVRVLYCTYIHTHTHTFVAGTRSLWLLAFPPSLL